MSTGYKGRDALLYISTNGGSTFTALSGVRVTNFTINNDPADISNVDSNGFKELLPDGGLQSVEISIEGVVVNANAFKTLVTQAMQRTSVNYKINFGNAAVIQGLFVVNNFQEGAQVAGAQTFSCSLASTFTVTLTPPT